VFDSTIGRWQSKDPKSFDAGDTNLYRYVGNHPSYATDPSGLEIVLPKEEKDRFLSKLRADGAGKLADNVAAIERNDGKVIFSIPKELTVHEAFPFKLGPDFVYFNANDKNHIYHIAKEVVSSMLHASRTIEHESLEGLQLEVSVRTAIVALSLDQRLTFSEGGTQAWNSQYWVYPGGDFDGHFVKPGLTPSYALVESVRSNKMQIGCNCATKMTVIGGIAIGHQVSNGKPEYKLENPVVAGQWNEYAQPHELAGNPSWQIDIHARTGGEPRYDEQHYYSFVDQIADGDLIPGDWMYALNLNDNGSIGDEGHNAIYIGWGKEALWGKALDVRRKFGGHVWSTNVGVPSPKMFQGVNGGDR
jgi:hypothetical protein